MMKFQHVLNKKLKTVAAVLLATSIMASCSKETDVESLSKSRVMFNVGVENGNISPIKAASRSSRVPVNLSRQVEIDFNSEIRLVARITPIKGQATNGAKTSVFRGSSGSEVTPLSDGAKYTILAFKDDLLVGEPLEFVVGSSENVFELDPGVYTFVTYASGSGQSLPAPSGNFSTSSFEELAAGTDLMYFVDRDRQILEGSNNINVTLKHIFSELTVKLNTAALGNATIGGGTYSKGFSKASVKLDGGQITGSDLADQTMSFPGGNISGNVFTSAPAMLIPDGQTASVKLNSVTIGSQTKDLLIAGLDIQEGTRYELTLNVKAKETADLGGYKWSLGSLTYDRATGEYGFSQNDQPGDFFFPDRVIPKDLDPANGNQEANGSNGATGDPCALVAGGKYRLPNRTEVQSLMSSTEVGGSSNPGTPSPWAPARYTDYFSVGGQLGVFYGTQVKPTSDKIANYLFMAFFGAYHNNFSNTITDQALYLVSDDRKPIGYSVWHITGTAGTINYGNALIDVQSTSAVQVVCVKD